MKVKRIILLLLVAIIALSAENGFGLPGWTTYNTHDDRVWFDVNNAPNPATSEHDIVRVSDGNGETFLIKENMILTDDPADFVARLTFSLYEEHGGIVFNWNGPDNYYYLAMRLLPEGDRGNEIAIFKNNIPLGSSNWESSDGYLGSYSLGGPSPFSVPYGVNSKSINITVSISTGNTILLRFSDDDSNASGFGYYTDEPITVDSKVGFAYSSFYKGDRMKYQFKSWSGKVKTKPKKPVRGSAYFF